MSSIRNINFLKPLSIKNKIRIGPPHDGGYIVYKPILKNAILLTYGVGWDVSFESHFNSITSNKVLMFDPTMFNTIMIDKEKIKRLLNNLQINALVTYLLFIKNFWLKKLILKKRNVIFINEGIDIRKSGKYNTLVNHLQKHSLLNNEILLKIDIEGKEYEIFEEESIFNCLGNVTQILFEFHYLEKYFSRFEKIVNRLKLEYDIVHIHGNNCSKSFPFKILSSNNKDVYFPDVVELTFVRRNKIIDNDITDKIETYPTPGLDYPNQPGRKDYLISFYLGD